MIKMSRNRRPRRVRISLEDTKYQILTTARRRLGWTEVDIEDDWDVCWIDSSANISRILKLVPHQRLNHFMGMMELCRKKCLSRNMTTMAACFPKLYNFTPQTFNLPQAMDKALCALKGGRKTFILKPDGGSQGKGIRLVQTPEQLRASLEDMPTCEIVMSKYLHRPLLLRGCKFDLRIYLLVTSCDPLRVFIYEEGLVRFCTQRYEAPAEENLGKRYIHITNYAVNRQNARRASSSDTGIMNDTKWSLSDLRRYMAAARQPFDPIWNKIRHIITLSLLGIQPALQHHYRAARPAGEEDSVCFELLGYDIMLDDTGKPWLLEVNHSPSFSTEMAVDRQVKEQLLKDTLLMVQPEFASDAASSCPPSPCSQSACAPQDQTHRSESAAAANGFIRARDAHEAAYCGGFQRSYPSDDPALQEKYETVLQAAAGAFEMSILARAHRTVTKIQERRRKMEEEEAERERQEQAKFNAIREMARRRATMPQEPVPNPKARMRVMAKQTLSMPRLSLDLQFGGTANQEVLHALQRLNDLTIQDPQSCALQRSSSSDSIASILPSDSGSDVASCSDYEHDMSPMPEHARPATSPFPSSATAAIMPAAIAKRPLTPSRIDLDAAFSANNPTFHGPACRGDCAVCSLPPLPGITAGMNPPNAARPWMAGLTWQRPYQSETGLAARRALNASELRRTSQPSFVNVGPPAPKAVAVKDARPMTPTWSSTLRKSVSRSNASPSARELTAQLIWEASRPARKSLSMQAPRPPTRKTAEM